MNFAANILFFIVVIAVNSCDARNIRRVIDGSDAPNHRYPYIVSFQSQTLNMEDHHFCSGSIINNHWILTAGHCFYHLPLDDVVAVVGTNYLNQKGDRYQIDLSIVHERYEGGYYDDIGLIRVASPIQFTDNVSPVHLPINDLYNTIIPASFSGWGVTKLGGHSPNELQEIQLNIMPNEMCQRFHYSTITPEHICSFSKYGSGLCFGDSGGPLMVNGTQVGIASYVRPCAVGRPDVHTRVFQYLTWIDQTISTNNV